ncbi:MAG TPA: patatin-like phospholipase family protein [Longimicrobiales bacterium]|nr:patatin-like phospholipase family protein [Longimicrobiales bacterium]
MSEAGEVSAEAPPSSPPQRRGEELGELAFVLTGGGARAAYQVGVLHWLAERYPELHVPIITGVSAGAVNAAHLASHHGSYLQAMEELVHLWCRLRVEDVFRSDPVSLFSIGTRWMLRLLLGGFTPTPRVKAMLDTEPLRRFLTEALAAVDGKLTGIDYNLQRGRLRAVAISTTSYTTGQSLVWVQGRDPAMWTRPKRRSIHTPLSIEHVMASSALPFFFPAVQLEDGHWYGDGGIRLTAPLSPALHLGAHRILAISTRFDRSQAQADEPAIAGYPPPAQVAGLLMNAVFLDLIDQDALRLETMNRVLERLEPEERKGMRVVKMLVIRPSKDLGQLAAAYEPRLPWTLRLLSRGLGTRETRSPDILAMLLFQPDYLKRLIDLGRADAEAQADKLVELIEGGEPTMLGTMEEQEAGRTLRRGQTA